MSGKRSSLVCADAEIEINSVAASTAAENNFLIFKVSSSMKIQVNWISDCRFPISDFRFPENSAIANRQSQISLFIPQRHERAGRYFCFGKYICFNSRRYSAIEKSPTSARRLSTLASSSIGLNTGSLFFH